MRCWVGLLLLEEERAPPAHRPSDMVLGTGGRPRLQTPTRGLRMRQVEYALLRSPGTNPRKDFPLGSCAMGPDSKVTIFQPDEAEPTWALGACLIFASGALFESALEGL